MEKELTEMPSANVVHEYHEHQNAHNIEHYKYNPEYMIAFSLQRHNNNRNFKTTSATMKDDIRYALL